MRSARKRIPGVVIWIALLVLALRTTVQAQYTYKTNNGTITITGYTGPGGAVTIPSIITGLPVASIGSEAFYYKASLTSVTVPDSVTSIEDSAFSGCISLSSVTIPNGLTNIGSEAFGDCTSLSGVTIPNSVTSIGSYAFYSCTSLTAITVDALNSAYSSVGGVMFNKNQAMLIQFPAGKSGSYTIPNSVTIIGDGAFYFCISLTTVTIPDSVTSIGDQAFYSCTSLTAITVDELNSAYNSVDGVLFNKGQTKLIQFPVGRAGSYTIPNGVTNIGNDAFAFCSSLTNITMPNSVTSIGDLAFYYCSGMTSVTIPNSVTSIGDWAFGYCTRLTGVYFQGNVPGIGSDIFYNNNNASVFYLPGTTGWGSVFAGRPTALWSLPYPLILNDNSSFGVQTNGFGFLISWATDASVVVEASTSLANPIWSSLATNTLTGGSSYFSDPQWTNFPGRFYRLRSP